VHWLPAAANVDNAQPHMTEHCAAIAIDSIAVGAAVSNAVEHPPHQFGARITLKIDNTSNSAHIRSTRSTEPELGGNLCDRRSVGAPATPGITGKI
jgi:hypothetical protein